MINNWAKDILRITMTYKAERYVHEERDSLV